MIRKTNKYPLSALLLSVLLTLLLSCAGRDGLPPDKETADFFGLSKILAHDLLNGGKVNLNKNDRIILTSFVNLDDLYRTSGFGRSMTEALSTELFQRGYKILEIRKSPKIYIKTGKGELALSRDASLLAQSHNAYAILTGTYSLTPSTVILNVKILSAFSRDVLAAGALEIRRTANINYLLSHNKKTIIGQISAHER